MILIRRLSVSINVDAILITHALFQNGHIRLGSNPPYSLKGESDEEPLSVSDRGQSHFRLLTRIVCAAIQE